MGGAQSWGGERKCAGSSTQENPGQTQEVPSVLPHPRIRGNTILCYVVMLPPKEERRSKRGRGRHPPLHSVSPTQVNQKGLGHNPLLPSFLTQRKAGRERAPSAANWVPSLNPLLPNGKNPSPRRCSSQFPPLDYRRPLLPSWPPPKVSSATE
jgi:hypothetical protein